MRTKNEDPDVIADRKIRTKYYAHKANAKQRGIPFELTYSQWLEIWGDKLQFRGNRRDQLVMMRNKDIGPYAVGNVSIGTTQQNASDSRLFRFGSSVRTPYQRVRAAKKNLLDCGGPRPAASDHATSARATTMTPEDLQALLNRLGWTGYRLAQELDVTGTAAYNWLNGTTPISRLLVLALGAIVKRQSTLGNIPTSTA